MIVALSSARARGKEVRAVAADYPRISTHLQIKQHHGSYGYMYPNESVYTSLSLHPGSASTPPFS